MSRGAKSAKLQLDSLARELPHAALQRISQLHRQKHVQPKLERIRSLKRLVPGLAPAMPPAT